MCAAPSQPTGLRPRPSIPATAECLHRTEDMRSEPAGAALHPGTLGKPTRCTEELPTPSLGPRHGPHRPGRGTHTTPQAAHWRPKRSPQHLQRARRPPCTPPFASPRPTASIGRSIGQAQHPPPPPPSLFSAVVNPGSSPTASSSATLRGRARPQSKRSGCHRKINHPPRRPPHGCKRELIIFSFVQSFPNVC